MSAFPLLPVQNGYFRGGPNWKKISSNAKVVLSVTQMLHSVYDHVVPLPILLCFIKEKVNIFPYCIWKLFAYLTLLFIIIFTYQWCLWICSSQANPLAFSPFWVSSNYPAGWIRRDVGIWNSLKNQGTSPVSASY